MHSLQTLVMVLLVELQETYEILRLLRRTGSAEGRLHRGDWHKGPNY
jgi:hypothetical protein